MLEAILRHLHNWFVVGNGIHVAEFKIESGALPLPFLAKGQYYRIDGSLFNDGLHKYGDTDLVNETFTGAVWALLIPKAVIELAGEIEEWETKNGAAASPYQSESFGGYSYTRATDSKTGLPLTWQAAFRGRLNPWRKI